jgi:pyroglutamyl-peptidase
MVPPRAAIAVGAGTSIRGRAPFSRLLAAARATRVKTIFSRDAGNYLCNYVYWRALEAAASPGGPRRVVFVHIPRVASRSRRRAGKKSTRFTLNDLARVAEAILAAVSRR